MKKISALALICAVLLSFASCKRNHSEQIPEAPYPVSVGGVSIDKAPERVVVLSEGIYEYFVRLELESKIVGVCDSLAAAENGLLPIGKDHDINKEKLFEIAPDAVFSFVAFSAAEYSEFSEKGIKVFVFSEPKELSDVYKIAGDISKIFSGNIEGRAKSEALRAQTEIEIALLKDKLALIAEPYLYFSSAALSSFSEKSIFSEVMAQVLCEPVSPASSENEAIIASNPKVLYIDSSVDKARILSNEGFENISAIKDSKVYSINGNAVSKAGPSSVRKLEEEMKSIFPLLFPEAEE